MAKPNKASIDAYLEDVPPETRSRLTRIREIVHKIAPGAVETVSYGVPTFDLEGKHLVHFAGFSRHVGMYPVPVHAEDLPEPLRAYAHGQGTARFPLDEPLPEDLVRWIVERQLKRLQQPGGGQ